MPELGKYAVSVLSAYGVSLGLLVVLLAQQEQPQVEQLQVLLVD